MRQIWMEVYGRQEGGKGIKGRNDEDEGQMRKGHEEKGKQKVR